MLLAELETRSLRQHAGCFSSDNGGERLSDNTLFHHKSTLWEGGIRVPCLMRWPARLPQGKTTSQVGITMDLSATFAAVAGATPQSDRPFDGINLLPIIAGEQPEQPRTLCWRIDRAGRQQKTVRHGKWKHAGCQRRNAD
jgi:arylsulfatase A-like enzyme